MRLPWNRRRRAHRSPPLRVVRAERDEAHKRVQELEWQISSAEAVMEDQEALIARLRRRVAHLENAFSVSVPAPMDLKAQQPTVRLPWQQKRPQGRTRNVHKTARVVPLHVALGGQRA